MTYGWAILIIAVVLGALFQLGIFNASTFTPKAPPGACHVFRPNGPGTTSFINTQGICNGELPQYVAVFNGQINNFISVTKTSTLNSLGTTGKFTVSAWVYYTNGDLCNGVFGDWTDPSNGFNLIAGGAGGNNCAPLYVGPNWAALLWPAGYDYLPQYQWEMITATYDGSTGYAAIYLNNQVFQSGTILSGQGLLESAAFKIGGVGWTTSGTFKGKMANVQLYNTSLSSSEIAALFNEGVGGSPVKLSNLVGWWPLNGDAKDYSGNNNNGAASGITFTSNWESGYSSP